MEWEILRIIITIAHSNHKHITAAQQISRNHLSSFQLTWTKIPCCRRRTCHLRSRWDPKQIQTESLNRGCHLEALTLMATGTRIASFRKNNRLSTQKVKIPALICKSLHLPENWHPKQRVRWAREPSSKVWYNQNVSICMSRTKLAQSNNLISQLKTTALHNHLHSNKTWTAPSILWANPLTMKTLNRIYDKR